MVRRFAIETFAGTRSGNDYAYRYAPRATDSFCSNKKTCPNMKQVLFFKAMLVRSEALL